MLIGKNKKKMGKKALCLIFALIFSINSFAAVISDNDGSAFITKAEFESLKNSFNEQIDQYNSSIDSKIDGAIASYLAGIQLSIEPENLYEKIMNSIGGHLNFVKGTKATTDTFSPEINISCINRYYVKTNVSPDLDYESWRTYEGSTDTGYFSHMLVRVIPNAQGTGGGNSINNFDECRDRAGPWTGWDHQTQDATYGVYYRYFRYNQNTGGGIVGKTDFSRNAADRALDRGSAIWNDAAKNPLVKLKNNNLQTISNDGSGSAYTYQIVSGNRVLDEYASSYWPILRGSAYWHSYGDFWAKSLENFRTWHEYNNGMKLTTVQTADTERIDNWGSKSWGTSITDEAESNGYWGTVTYALCKNTDGVEYSVIQWGIGTDVDIYACSTNEAVIIDTASTEFTFNNSTYSHDYYDYNDLTKKTQTNDLPSNKLKYYKPSITPSSYKLNTFVNSYLTAIAGETVYIGGGMPILKTTDGDQTIRVKFNVTSTGGTSNKVKVLISDKQFKNGTFASDATQFYSNDCDVDTDYEVTIDVARNNQNIWMNIYDIDTTINQTAHLNDLKIELV